MATRRRDLPSKDLTRPSKEQQEVLTQRLHTQLESMMTGKASMVRTGGDIKPAGETSFVRFTSSAGTQRIVHMHEAPLDPLEPVRFKHRRVPRGPMDDAVPIQRSPPRKLTAKDQELWKIPPCISNWKNNKGYTIPLEMRLSADGRHLQDRTVSEKFPKLAEALYAAERKAREEIDIKASIEKQLAVKEALRKEEEMRIIAAQARLERLKLIKEDQDGGSSGEDSAEGRNDLRYKANREVERDYRMRHRKQKTDSLAQRDISEKVALGQTVPTASESMFDQRLFNQTQGMDAGYASEEDYNIYDKPLFQDRSQASIYRNVRDPEQEPEGRSRPVEFEQVQEDEFGLGSLAKKARKQFDGD